MARAKRGQVEGSSTLAQGAVRSGEGFAPPAEDRAPGAVPTPFANEPLDVEATPLDEDVHRPDAPFADDDLPTDADAVFDDEFIRARRALNAARRRGPAAAATATVIEPDRPDDGLSEVILGTSPVWRGAFLTAEDVSVRLPNGRIAQRDVLRHPGAVAVIALTEDGKLVLVHQYRTAIEQVTLEIPAGKLDLGEDPAEAAARELMEETGYMASRMAYLGPIAMAPGYSDEIIHLYMAMGLTFVGACPDEDEFVHVDLVDLDDMIDRVLDGKVIDAKTVAGVMLCDAIARRMDAQ